MKQQLVGSLDEAAAGMKNPIALQRGKMVQVLDLDFGVPQPRLRELFLIVDGRDSDGVRHISDVLTEHLRSCMCHAQNENEAAALGFFMGVLVMADEPPAVPSIPIGPAARA